MEEQYGSNRDGRFRDKRVRGGVEGRKSQVRNKSVLKRKGMGRSRLWCQMEQADGWRMRFQSAW